MFNWPAFAKRTSDLDLEQASDLLSTFVANSNDHMRALSTEGRARSAVAKLAGAMGASASELGFVDLSQSARQVEMEAGRADIEALRDLIGQLERSLEQAGREIEMIQLMGSCEGP